MASATDRMISEFDDTNLNMARQRRSESESDHLLLLAPLSSIAKGAQAPMNVAAVDELGHMQWAASVDIRRLTLTPSSEITQAHFAQVWQSLDEWTRSDSDEPAQVWWFPEPVGESPRAGTAPWVEYGKARPWLEISGTELGIQVVAPLTTRRRSPLPRYQAAIVSEAIVAADDRLRCIDQWIELNHFAVVDPVQEGWERLGEVTTGAIKNVRAAFLAWPDRSDDGQVSIRER